MAASKRIAVVATSVGQYATIGYRTGLWLSELVHFHNVVRKAGHEVDVVSIAGGFVPLDPESLGSTFMRESETRRAYADRSFMSLLEATQPVAELDPSDYDAVFLAGGHGAMFDFPASEGVQHLVGAMADAGRVVAAVCHGPAGLLDVRVAGGDYLLTGRKVTGFSWTEERLAQRRDAVPFSLEADLKARGAKYRKALRPFAPHVVRDGRLVTGQNPASAAPLAKAVVRLLK